MSSTRCRFAVEGHEAQRIETGFSDFFYDCRDLIYIVAAYNAHSGYLHRTSVPFTRLDQFLGEIQYDPQSVDGAAEFIESSRVNAIDGNVDVGQWDAGKFFDDLSRPVVAETAVGVEGHRDILRGAVGKQFEYIRVAQRFAAAYADTGAVDGDQCIDHLLCLFQSHCRIINGPGLEVAHRTVAVAGIGANENAHDWAGITRHREQGVDEFEQDEFV